MPVTPFPGSEAVSGPLGDPALDPAAQLAVVLEELSRARGEWDTASQALDKLLEQSYTDEQHKTARGTVRAAYARWSEVLKQANELAESARRAAPLGKSAQRLYEETLEGLKDQFADGGPHYDLLCERVAGLHMRLKVMEQAGRAYPPAEHARVNHQLLSYINQLQRYTEAMKTETISKEAQGVAEKILQVVERNLATSHPELWRGVVRDVRLALESAA